MSKKHPSILFESLETHVVENYQRDTRFLADYLEFAQRYHCDIGDYSLSKIKKFIKQIPNENPKTILSEFYHNLTMTVAKLTKDFTIPENLVFLDLHKALVNPQVIKKDLEIQSLEDMIKLLETESLEVKRTKLHIFLFHCNS